MFFTDIHSHILFGTDDGAKDEREMYQMLDCAYQNGTRTLCLTPHFSPAYFPGSNERAEAAYAALCAYQKEKYPDMTLYLGNELRYYPGCLCDLETGACRLLGGKYLLTDFLPDISLFTMRYAVDELLSGGHRLILAHIERYPVLMGKERILAEWGDRGVRFQINADAFGRQYAQMRWRRHMKRIFSSFPIQAVASDAHDMTFRTPTLSSAYKVVSARLGEHIAGLLFSSLPDRILHGEEI